jgi:hypothetical protein
VRGSFSHPPIVVKGARAPNAFSLPVMMVLCAVTWRLARTHPATVWWSYGASFFFGVLSLFVIVYLVAPPVLLIGPEGVTWKVAGRTRRFAWAQVADFRSEKVSAFSREICFDLRAAPDGAVDRSSFWGRWELRPDEICDLLNTARGRWSHVWSGGDGGIK